MSVVATTFGIGASTQPAGDGERGERGDQRDDPRRRAASARTRRTRRRAPAPSSAKLGQLPAHRGAASDLGRARAAAARRPRSGVIAPAGAEDPGDLGGEVPAAGEHLGAGAVGDHARRRRAGRRGRRTRAANSTSWVATSDRRAPLAPARRASRRARPCARGPCPGSARRGRRAPGQRRPPPRPAITIASASRWRSPPERSRGSASAAHSRPTASSAARARLARELVGDPLADEEVAGLWASSAQPPRRRDPAPGRLDQPGGGAQQGALAGAVSAHQRDALARLDREVDPAQDVARPVAGVELDPQVARRSSAAAGSAGAAPADSRERRLVGAVAPRLARVARRVPGLRRRRVGKLLAGPP